MGTITTGWVRALRAAMLTAAALAAPAVFAAPCAGFTDVTDDGPTGLCPSVEWIKNRGVTQGCGTGIYCPDQAVIRLHMAAFMKRLGDALTPVKLATDLRPGPVDLDLNVVVCQTADLNVAGFPRTAYVDATLSASAAADVSFAADVVMSTNSGASWTALNPATTNHGSAPANQYGSLSDIGSTNLDVGQNVRFGLRLSRGSVASAVNLTDSRCQTRALVYSRTGAASPY